MKVNKFFFSILFSLIPSLSFAVELHQATNQQLLDELAYRLRVGGDPTPVGAVVQYTCDMYGDMIVEVIGSTGAISTEKFNVYHNNRCRDQKTILDTHRSKIRQLTIIGICNNFGDMDRLSILANGESKRLPSIDINNTFSCLEQAAAMNSTSMNATR